jgi:hypothetical protein
MVKDHSNKVKKQNNDGIKKTKQLVVKAKLDAECKACISPAGSTASVQTTFARSSTDYSADGKEDNTFPVAAQPKDFEVFVDGFLPVKSKKPVDAFLPVKLEFLATAGLLPRTADRLAMDVILPLPDIPLIHRYILWHPPVEDFYFEIMPVEVWQTATGANANILFNSFQLTGMPPLLWKTRYKILPPLEIGED